MRSPSWCSLLTLCTFFFPAWFQEYALLSNAFINVFNCTHENRADHSPNNVLCIKAPERPLTRCHTNDHFKEIESQTIENDLATCVKDRSHEKNKQQECRWAWCRDSFQNYIIFEGTYVLSCIKVSIVNVVKCLEL